MSAQIHNEKKICKLMHRPCVERRFIKLAEIVTQVMVGFQDPLLDGCVD